MSAEAIHYTCIDAVIRKCCIAVALTGRVGKIVSAFYPVAVQSNRDTEIEIKISA